MDTIRINEKDNVAVNLKTGHKIALEDIAVGSPVIKYGFKIGTAIKDISKGEAVHTHNLKTALSGTETFEYIPEIETLKAKTPATIKAYIRANGEIGIRNDVWIVPTVGCVNGIARTLAEKTGAFAFTHPYGCSQLGGDQTVTQQILKGLVLHPNAGGVLVLGLGCENNNIGVFEPLLGDCDRQRIRFLNVQDCEDEISEGVSLIKELQKIAENDGREEVPVSRLKIGLKCGGSDGLSGITANAVVGGVCNRIAAMGGSAALSEVPEMFGAEQVLFRRCVSRQVFDKADKMIHRYKQYLLDHNQPVSENPSPGNKAGGITTLEEKSLGCVQKGGVAPVTDVLDYGDVLTTPGLSLVNGPGNDMVAVTNLTAAGCHLILFTTGRGTPLGAPVPTIKISSNTPLSVKKSCWIDFDAFSSDIDKKADELFGLILDVACGKETKNEENGYRDIAIFKSGVTM